MWIRPLVLGLLALLDLAIIGLLGIQWASKQAISLNLLLPTIVFNLFGAFIFYLSRPDE